MMGTPDAMRQERHDEPPDREEYAEDILRKQKEQDDESFGDFRSWDREDDLADYNDNEADDYRNE